MVKHPSLVASDDASAPSSVRRPHRATQARRSAGNPPRTCRAGRRLVPRSAAITPARAARRSV